MLRRTLSNAGLRREWDMEFVDNGPAALEEMDLAPFDVIVTDMRMPSMDGAELLNEVQRRHPHTVRIVPSGQSDQESIERSIARTHQYLSKPCDPQLLKATVGRACALRDKLANESLKRLVSQVTTLPSLPEVYHDVVRELRSPDASIQSVAQLISKDVGMTTKLLQLVNSSFFGLPRRIESPAHAASMLGLNVLKPVVLSASIFSQFDRTNIPDYSLEAFSNHCVVVSRCAHRIAEYEQMEKEVVADSQLAALVHDVGQLVLASNLATEFGNALRLARENETTLSAAEVECLGADHADVGAYLLGLWGLPEPILEAVAFHHQPSRCPAEVFGPLTAVHVANVLVSETPLCGPASANLEMDVEYLERLGLSERLPQWRQLVEEMIAPTVEA